MTRTAVICARTSPECPLSADDQIMHLKNVATNRGWTVSRVFADPMTIIKEGSEVEKAKVLLGQDVGVRQTARM